VDPENQRIDSSMISAIQQLSPENRAIISAGPRMAAHRRRVSVDARVADLRPDPKNGVDIFVKKCIIFFNSLKSLYFVFFCEKE
jgi:hypothetical protein